MNLKQRTEKQSRTLSNIKEHCNQVAQKQRLKKMKRRVKHIYREIILGIVKNFLSEKGKQEYSEATSYTLKNIVLYPVNSYLLEINSVPRFYCKVRIFSDIEKLKVFITRKPVLPNY